MSTTIEAGQVYRIADNTYVLILGESENSYFEALKIERKAVTKIKFRASDAFDSEKLITCQGIIHVLMKKASEILGKEIVALHKSMIEAQSMLGSLSTLESHLGAPAVSVKLFQVLLPIPSTPSRRIPPQVIIVHEEEAGARYFAENNLALKGKLIIREIPLGTAIHPSVLVKNASRVHTDNLPTQLKVLLDKRQNWMRSQPTSEMII